MMALAELVIVMALPLVLIFAVPLITCGAVGRAWAGTGASSSEVAVTIAAMVSGGGPPFPLTVSAATIHTSFALLQIKR